MSDDVYELYAIRYATNPRRRRVENLMWVAPDDPHDAPMPMDFFVWAAVSPSRTVVIDTGADERTCAARGHQFLRCPTDGLGQVGIEPPTSSRWSRRTSTGITPATWLVPGSAAACAAGGARARVGPMHGAGVPATAV